MNTDAERENKVLRFPEFDEIDIIFKASKKYMAIQAANKLHKALGIPNPVNKKMERDLKAIKLGIKP